MVTHIHTQLKSALFAYLDAERLKHGYLSNGSARRLVIKFNKLHDTNFKPNESVREWTQPVTDDSWSVHYRARKKYDIQTHGDIPRDE